MNSAVGTSIGPSTTLAHPRLEQRSVKVGYRVLLIVQLQPAHG